MKGPERKQLVMQFLSSLIENSEFRPFVDFDDQAFGLFDFQWITRNVGTSLTKLKIEFQKRKSLSIEWAACEIRNVFMQISDYLLLEDPFQATCSLGLTLINEFENQYLRQVKMRQAKYNESKHAAKLVSLAQQMEMIFYLKNYQHDEEIVRKIGEVCEILYENEDQYILDLSRSTVWQSIVPRQQVE